MHKYALARSLDWMKKLAWILARLAADSIPLMALRQKSRLNVIRRISNALSTGRMNQELESGVTRVQTKPVSW